MPAETLESLSMPVEPTPQDWPKKKLSVLLIEDRPDDAQLIVRHLKKSEFCVIHQVVENAAQLDTAMQTVCWEVVLCDHSLPSFGFENAIERIRAYDEHVPILMVTGTIGEEGAADVMRAGAKDVILKNKLDRLVPAIERELKDSALRRSQSDMATRMEVSERRFVGVIQSLQEGFALYDKDDRLVVYNQEFVRLNREISDLIEPGVRFETLLDAGIARGAFKGLPCADTETLKERLLRAHLAGGPMLRRNSDGVWYVIKESPTPDGGVAATLADVTREKETEEALRRSQVDLENRISERTKELSVEIEHRKEAEQDLIRANAELQEAYHDLKETQAQLIQAAKMASLGELVAGVAHEINNPLGFVMSHVGTVRKRLQDIAEPVERALDEAQRRKWDKATERVEDIREGLDRVHDLVIKLRTFSRIDQSEFKTVDMRDNIESAIALVQYRCKDRVAIRATHAEDSVLACFPSTLNQVVMNLISNAIDAIDGDGEVSIATERKGDDFVITVSDTGPGVPEDIRDRVFEPFFTTKPVGEGTGLGLALGYRIVDSHKGRIEISETETGGGMITVTIPATLTEADVT